MRARDVSATLFWSDLLVAGKYDIVVEVNGDGLYYAETDALDDNEIEVTARAAVVVNLNKKKILTPNMMFSLTWIRNY